LIFSSWSDIIDRARNESDAEYDEKIKRTWLYHLFEGVDSLKQPHLILEPKDCFFSESLEFQILELHYPFLSKADLMILAKDIQRENELLTDLLAIPNFLNIFDQLLKNSI